jgi:uncharacterized protein YndB with AHSA1/START domain
VVRIKEIRTINRSLAETWKYVSDFATVEEWDPGVNAASLKSGDGGLGTTYDVTATFAGREVPLVYEVTEFEPEKRIVLTTGSPNFSAVDTIEFSAVDDARTDVIYGADFDLKAPLKYVEFALKPLFNRLGTKAMDGMKSTLG